MAGRQSNQLRSKEQLHRPKPKGKKKSTRGGLDALTIAGHQYPSKSGIRKHRLGVEEDDGSSRKRRGGASRLDAKNDSSRHPSKRRRTGDNDDDSEDADSSDNYGSDSEGNEWQLGRVDEDDDSDIDSDEAMGESDGEHFDGFRFGGSSKPKPNSKPIPRKRGGEDFDLYEGDGELEDDGGGDDDLGEEAVDLATAWDMNAEESELDDKGKAKKLKRDSRSGTADKGDGIDITGSELEGEEDDEHDDDEDDDDEDDASDASGLSISDEDNINERGLSKLQMFVKAMEREQPRDGKSKTKQTATTQGAQPTEFGLMPTRKLTAADLIPTISDSRMRGSLKHLDAVPSTKKSKTGINGKLEVPLAKRQQDRIDRAAAYEKSKEALNRWIETVKANRRADHLSFPLPEPNALQKSTIVDTKPRTDLESTIQNILVESGLADEQDKTGEARIQEFEELQAKKLPLEEIQARRAELRKARELLFREEVRAKRIKKIKSKSYRRVHRKEREKMELREREALLAAGVDVNEEDREKLDRRRAEARMGAKHRESKWAKSLKQTGRTAWDDEARLGMADLARREEELQSRILGKRVTSGQEEYLRSSSEESESESDAGEDGFGSDAETQRLKKKLSELGQNRNDKEEITGPYAKLLSIKFMRNAEAARKAQNDAEVKKLRRELDGEYSQSDTEMAEVGHQKFGQQAATEKSAVTATKRQEFEEPDSDTNGKGHVEESDEDIDIKVDRKPAHKSTARSYCPFKTHSDKANVDTTNDDDFESNPWLSQPKRNSRKQTNALDAAGDITLITNGTVEGVTSPLPSSEQSMRITAPKKKAANDSHGNKAAATTTTANGDNDDESGDDSDEARVPVLLKNADLVKKAFAGDEVLADFSKEKVETVEEEGDKVIDTTLPGWGSWAGAGLTKREKKEAKAKRSFVTEEGVKAEKRKDAKLDRVIINEKRVRKNTKYLASQLPHPFESRQQYERSLRLPIGPEWTTKETFQNATKPRVMLKQGVIKPLQKPLL
ncbi:hypothetical protein GX48_03707 [Paracoccidioides brasiliensis]|nr:hypothetical protein GX48_03707 [Paracoccidioides brasiliensis]